ncbi:unnamed protein product [Leptidea sinapis]|uniref:Uncharacterized protein n=1 Tax=Leptidea sinapis TaxID=189913 RepID=A0A5E4Q7A0_9NEOP|nr:unnamed protein product [Leptidea sinapis]
MDMENGALKYGSNHNNNDILEEKLVNESVCSREMNTIAVYLVSIACAIVRSARGVVTMLSAEIVDVDEEVVRGHACGRKRSGALGGDDRRRGQVGRRKPHNALRRAQANPCVRTARPPTVRVLPRCGASYVVDRAAEGQRSRSIPPARCNIKQATLGEGGHELGSMQNTAIALLETASAFERAVLECEHLEASEHGGFR